ncbi:DM13 domain-containing protein [Nanoarchaeota archaeon]
MIKKNNPSMKKNTEIGRVVALVIVFGIIVLFLAVFAIVRTGNDSGNAAAEGSSDSDSSQETSPEADEKSDSSKETDSSTDSATPQQSNIVPWPSTETSGTIKVKNANEKTINIRGKVVSEGKFSGRSGKRTSGSLRVIKTITNAYIVAFGDDFQTERTRGTQVYLVKKEEVPDDKPIETGFSNLGLLETGSGAQMYYIKDTTDLSEYDFVAIYAIEDRAPIGAVKIEVS